jgi:hypothetical protein
MWDRPLDWTISIRHVSRSSSSCRCQRSIKQFYCCRSSVLPRQRSTGSPNLVPKFFALDGNGQTRSRRKSVPFVVEWLLFHFRIDDSPLLSFFCCFLVRYYSVSSCAPAELLGPWPLLLRRRSTSWTVPTSTATILLLSASSNDRGRLRWVTTSRIPETCLRISAPTFPPSSTPPTASTPHVPLSITLSPPGRRVVKSGPYPR